MLVFIGSSLYSGPGVSNDSTPEINDVKSSILVCLIVVEILHDEEVNLNFIGCSERSVKANRMIMCNSSNSELGFS